MKKLFIIEAPGKVKSFRMILNSIGVDAEVAATKGHLYSFPKDLSISGIDEKFNDVGRVLINPEGAQYIRNKASEVEQIIIATDADNEGDVIAWDVYSLIKDINDNILRLKLKGMDKESIEESMETIHEIRKNDAIPGRTRAIVDRMIGHTYSKDGVGVGRVLTAILGIVTTESLSCQRLRLTAPSKSAGRPWSCYIDTNSVITDAIASKLIKLNFPAITVKSSEEYDGSVGHMGDIMIKAGDELYMTPKETAQSMQNMYEAGQMSYPRSGSKGISKGAQRRLAKLMKASGSQGVDVSNIKEKEAGETHDAPYPIGNVDFSKDPKKLGDDLGVRNLVARNFVRSSQKRVIEKGHTKTIYDFLLSEGFSKEVSLYVAKADWTREVGPRFPGQESWGKNEIQERMPETVLLEKVIEKGLGKPSTWANHIENFMSKGLVNSNLELTSKGQEWVSKSPKELLDPRLSSAIEKACDRIIPSIMNSDEKEPWSGLAEKIINAVPDNLKSEIKSKLHTFKAENVPSYEKDVADIEATHNKTEVYDAQSPTYDMYSSD